MSWSKTILVFGALCLLTSTLALQYRPVGAMRVWFFDVGQGDGAMVETPSHHRIVIDGGPDDSIMKGIGGVMPPWEKTIDLIIISHPQADHITGLISIIERYDVKLLLMTGVDGKTKTYRRLQAAIAARHVRVQFVETTFHLDFGDGVTFASVWPTRKISDGEIDDLNETCIVGKFVYEKRSVLFTGDIAEETEAQIDRLPFDLHVDVLKEPHHGSRFGLLPEFLAKVHPKYDVISVGAKNRYGHPAPSTLQKLDAAHAKYWRTDRNGTVEAVIQNGIVAMKPSK